MPIRIKNEYKKTYVAFGKGNRPLGERMDIYVLARLGKERNSSLLKYFEDPDSITDEDINMAEEEHFNILQEAQNTG
jgi:hypothetical protein